MIILKDVPGLTTAEVMHAIADRIPLDQVETGYGGLVVDERTALVFLTRYLEAVAGNPPPDTNGEDDETPPGKTPAKRGRPKKEVEA